MLATMGLITGTAAGGAALAAAPGAEALAGAGGVAGVSVSAHGAPLAVLAIALLPLLGAALCALTAPLRLGGKLPAWITVGGLAAAFGLTVLMHSGVSGLAAGEALVAHGYEWIAFQSGAGPGDRFVAPFGFYLDSLTSLWMLFVTGLGCLIALYASEYMEHDVGLGYARFFVAFNLFVFSMACLVMADNLLLLFLGWEGVGLCSYLLIGYFYKKPEAVAAAKKAFIVNRVGDFGLLLGILTIFGVFGTVEYAALFPKLAAGRDALGEPLAAWVGWVVPLLLVCGAFGKSAQLFFYVWLPDAMEGPTPVSALIHAATMVTAGVYLIARMFPAFTLDEQQWVLGLVAASGAVTALWSATIAMAQHDIKRIMGYSTISQLGYMFAGLGVLTTTGAAFHVFTHAFFKATLFLCCGAVMHGFAGQLDLRRLSGVWWVKGWGIIGAAMLVGCLNLAGFPFTAGFFSKDTILAQAFVTPGAAWVGWVLLLTAGLTAYYTFRVFFRVFVGPVEYHPGQDDHGHQGDDGHAHSSQHGHAGGHGHASGQFHPHAPRWAINSVVGALAVLSIAAAATYFVYPQEHGWVGKMVGHSTAAFAAPGEHHSGAHADPHSDAHSTDLRSNGAAHAAALGTFLGFDPHAVMYYVSALVGAVGIGVAYLLHGAGRRTAATAGADGLLRNPLVALVHRGAHRKWYVDEVYHALITLPLWVLGHVLHLVDRLLVDGLVNAVGAAPKLTGGRLRVQQSGVLNGYAVAMAGGIALVVLLVVFMTN